MGRTPSKYRENTGNVFHREVRVPIVSRPRYRREPSR